MSPELVDQGSTLLFCLVFGVLLVAVLFSK